MPAFARGLAARLLVGVVVLAAVAGIVVAVGNAAPYTVTAVLPAGNPNLIEGAPIYVDGFSAGSITEVAPVDNQAVVTVAIDRELAPLHAGAFFHVQWKALVGERLLFIEDGPAANAEIPSGGMVEGEFPKPTEVADVLAALDPATRDDLSSLINRLDGTLEGSERDFNQTVRTAGPSLAAVGEVLRGIGTDGPAIEALVTDLNAMMGTIAERDADLSAVVDDLTTSTGDTVAVREQLREALTRLPGTLRTAQGVLESVPGVTEEALPLLADLDPATARLAGVSEQLAPLLADLRPLVGELKPTLQAASVLLDRTPGLLDGLDTTLPGVEDLTANYAPVLEFLRPYTPDVTAFVLNWGSAGQNFDANGRYMRIFAEAGTTSPVVNPGVVPPGIVPEPENPPYSADTPSANTDASGEGMN